VLQGGCISRRPQNRNDDDGAVHFQLVQLDECSPSGARPWSAFMMRTQPVKGQYPQLRSGRCRLWHP
jgi:hypothetical protein